jgi:carboxyl-terminal processing protease
LTAVHNFPLPKEHALHEANTAIRRILRKPLVITAGLAVLLGSGAAVYTLPVGAAGAATSSSTPCAAAPEEPSGPPPTPAPTTIATLRQAYECIFAHYYSGSTLDDRTLLVAGFTALTEELQRRGIDQSMATLPKLTGNRAHDWTVFAKVYQDVLAALPDDAQLRQALAAVTMRGMVASLDDNHNAWLSAPASPGNRLGLGIVLGTGSRTTEDIRDAAAPVYLKSVLGGSPADAAGLRPGDIIEAVNNQPLFTGGMLSGGVLGLLNGQDVVRVTVNRPAVGKTWTVELRPAALTPPARPTASVTLLDNGIVRVVLPEFAPGAADKVLSEIGKPGTQPRGIVLDVRGNGGGRDEEVAKLLSAFAHDKVYSWDCDAKDQCTPHRTDSVTPLLNLPLVVLTDDTCASACDAFSAAVRDLRLGKLVGVRTAGMVSGLPTGYLLDDNSTLLLTSLHQTAANGEVINGIGVAVDHQAPMTAADLSAGRDPALNKALTLLAG